MKKKLLGMALAVIMTMQVFVGCGATKEKSDTTNTSNESQTSEGNSNGDIVIGISVLNLTGQFFIQLVDAAQTECDSIGATLMTNACDSDSANQIDALENFISAGCDAIIVCAVDSEATAPVIAKAKEQGIAVVCLTSTIDGYDAYIGCDEYTLGYTQGVAVGARIAEMYGTEEPVEAATLNYDLMESVIARKEGIIAGVQEKAPNVTFVADATAADQEEGMTATENFLQANPNLKVVCGVSDGAALGAYQAFKAAGLTDSDKYLVAGIDATDEALSLIEEGTIYQVSVSQNPTQTGKDLVDTAVKVINNEEFEKDSYFDLEAVTVDNVSDYK
ncbi:MAG: sugar ABC transporter substrate-binding protein [Pseudobutyrivibrio sp.]|nr:sugar ABC transporter substrate-binding protein [Pseudobutyrivibrio sp.]